MELEHRLRQRVLRLAVATGAAFSTMSIWSLISNDPEHYIDALMMIPFSLMLLAVIGVHELQRDSGLRSELIGFRVLAITLVTMLISQPTIVFDISELSWIAFPGAFLGFLVGTAFFGYGTYRAGVLPSWCGILLGLSQLLTIGAGVALSPISPLEDYGDYTGAIMHGLTWFTIAFALYVMAPSRMTSIERTTASAA